VGPRAVLDSQFENSYRLICFQNAEAEDIQNNFVIWYGWDMYSFNLI